MAEEEKASYKCVLCDSLVESKEALQEHFRKHANKKIDNKETLAKLKTPKKVIKKEVLLKTDKPEVTACDVCGQEFTNSARAIQHKFRKHPDVLQKYICPYCGMQFTLKSLFDNHVENHSPDKREKNSLFCEECGAMFYFQEAKDYHFKVTHKRVEAIFQPVPTPPPSKKIKMNHAGEIQSVYYCHLCGSQYVLKYNLQEHLKKVHSENERCTMPSDLIRCTTCDAIFYNKKAFESHNVGHKPDDLYVTSEEQRLQTVSRIDQDFDIRRVLPSIDKYLPSYKHKPKINQKRDVKVKEDVQDEELSPPSTPESTDSDSESDVPLIKLKEKIDGKELKQVPIAKVKEK